MFHVGFSRMFHVGLSNRLRTMSLCPSADTRALSLRLFSEIASVYMSQGRDPGGQKLASRSLDRLIVDSLLPQYETHFRFSSRESLLTDVLDRIITYLICLACSTYWNDLLKYLPKNVVCFNELKQTTFSSHQLIILLSNNVKYVWIKFQTIW